MTTEKESKTSLLSSDLVNDTIPGVIPSYLEPYLLIPQGLRSLAAEAGVHPNTLVSWRKVFETDEALTNFLNFKKQTGSSTDNT